MCGSTGAQNEQLQSAMDLSSAMSKDFAQVFGVNTSILNNLKESLSPIVAAGVGQYGYTPAEDTALRTGSTEAIEQANRAATDVTRSQLASEGGGTSYLPTGSEATIEAGLAETEAQKQAEAQSNITAQGYATGRQNFFAAEGAEAAAPGELENPATSLGGAAVGAGSSAMSDANAVAAANAQPWQMAAGLIGGLGSAALEGPLGKG